MLEYIPANFKVIRHVRPKCACTKCDALSKLRRLAHHRPRTCGTGLLAHVLVSKYADHLPAVSPVGDLCSRRRRSGSLDAGRLGGSCQLFTLSVGRSATQACVAASKIHADDTPVPVLAPGTGKTKTGRLWTYVRDDRPAGDVPPSRVVRLHAGSQGRTSQAASEELLGRVAGRCLCWISSSVRRRQDRRSRMLGSCTAQVLRHSCGPRFAITAEAIQRIGKLYDIEREIRGKPADLRCEVRQARAPLIDDLQLDA